MGCTTSKLDDLPAVALCRERCVFLDEAILQRFALADSHNAYIHSLRMIGNSLHHFIEQDSDGSGFAPLSAKLNLPPQRKGDPDDEGTSSPKKPHLAAHHSHSNSGSHLQFHSDSDSELDDSDSHLHHSEHTSPLHHLGGGGYVEYMPSEYMSNEQDSYPGGGGGGFLHMNYMKNKATTPSVVFQQRPFTPETVHFGESSSSYYYPNSNTNNYNPYPINYYGYPNYGPGEGAVSGYYGSSPPYGSSAAPPAVASSSKSPPPPPPPPTASTWDFLNLFENNENLYPGYTPSRDSKDLREEEGIPDLEDEEYQHEVVKEVYGREKYVDSGSGSAPNNYSKSVMMEDGDSKGGGNTKASLYQTRPNVSMENDNDDGLEYDVHVVGEKKVVDDERSEERRNGGFKRGGGFRDASQVAFEIKIQFERASDSGKEIAKMLEVGRLPYQRKHVAKMLHVVTPSLSIVSSQPSTSKSIEPSDKADPAYLEVDEELTTRSKNLSSTLQKLHLWEKKLYNEVKVEEKMRVAHERKCRKLKHLDERGAEAHKVDATRVIIKDLSTKIRIAIQVVDKISVTINKIRDEELWPQLNELIHGLTRMWKNMLECHQNQCQAVKEAKGLGSIGSGIKFGDDHLKATLQLEHDLVKWISSFQSWIGAQRGYVKALNNWLTKCLLYEPEETADGIAPFSPGRMGAPPIFVICNQWAQAMEIISEKEVLDALRILASSVLKLWERDKLELRQRMVANKDLERKVRHLDREDQKIHKELKALDKKNVLVGGGEYSLSVSGNVVYQSDTSNISLQGSLQSIFEAMEKFMADSMKAYEDLIQRIEEERQRVSQGCAGK